jgi:hypothetical protein
VHIISVLLEFHTTSQKNEELSIIPVRRATVTVPDLKYTPTNVKKVKMEANLLKSAPYAK